jgi:hypothetical protein
VDIRARSSAASETLHSPFMWYIMIFQMEGL